MFAESLLESGNVHPKGRAWATTVSIAIQTLLIAALVALPLLRPDAMPLTVRSFTAPVAFGHPDAPPPESTVTRPVAPSSEARIVFSGRIPLHRPNEGEAMPGPYLPGPAIPGSPEGVRNLFSTIVPTNPPVVAVRPPNPPTRVSVPDPGKVILHVQPVYPSIARQLGIEGVVVLHAVIDREGHITGLQVVSGPPQLQEAARAAVRQWRYRPYFLNGLPVEVETQIMVKFTLNR